jgi:hypothetical protein
LGLLPFGRSWNRASRRDHFDPAWTHLISSLRIFVSISLERFIHVGILR